MPIFSIIVTVLLAVTSVLNVINGEYESAIYLGLLAFTNLGMALLMQEIRKKDEQIRKLKEES